MASARIILLTSLAMLAFAGNSLLCRLALKQTSIDAVSFTSVRLISGAVILWLLIRLRKNTHQSGGNWRSAVALFVYAAGFSLAYRSLPASAGALLLFGAVQATMIGYATWSGERLRKVQQIGLIIAVGGLVGLLLPGLSAPPLLGSILMIVAGIAWGVYSLLGKGSGDPIQVTTGNFVRTVPIAVLFSIFTFQSIVFDGNGIILAVLSGAITSGLGYAIWYTALPALKATQAATVQLSVPVIASLGGVLFLNEAISLRLVLASLATLGGILLIIVEKSRAKPVPDQAARS